MSSSLHPATVQKLLTDIRGILGQGFKQLCCKLEPTPDGVSLAHFDSFLGNSATMNSIPGHSFSIFKLTAQVIQLNTSIGTVIIPAGHVFYQTPVYTNPFYISSVSILSGGGALTDITIISSLLH
jgi:hypothetical protein